MLRKKIYTFLATFAVTATAYATPDAAPVAEPSNRSAKETVTDNAIKYIETINAKTEEKQKEWKDNWILQNCVVVDEKADKSKDKNTSDREYIARLKALSDRGAIEMPFNQVVKSYIEMYVKKRRSLVENMAALMYFYQPIFEEALERHNMPLELKYLPIIESAVNPNAVSRAGAAGLWQFMPGTGKDVGLELTSLVDERRDPIKSSDAAARYLKSLYDIYHDWSLAIAAYNCGPGNVNKALRRVVEQDGKKPDFWEIYPYLPSETRGYVPAFIAANYVMEYYPLHGIQRPTRTKKLNTDTVQVRDRLHFNQIAEVLQVPISELRTLNPQYRRDIVPGSSIKPYTLRLYGQQAQSFHLSLNDIKAFDEEKYANREVVEPKNASASRRGSRTSETARNNDSDSNSVSSSDDGFETQIVNKEHTVGRGETLRSIASRYGVSTASIKRANNLHSNKVQRGETLTIPTIKRVPKKAEGGSQQATADAGKRKTPVVEQDEEEEDETEEEEVVSATSRRTAASQTVAQPRSETRTYSKPEPKKKIVKEEPKYSKKDKKKKKEAAPKVSNHEVKSGESLEKIAKKSGVSVEDIRKANPNLKGDLIKPGENLKVPTKGSKSTAKEEKTSKKSKNSKNEKADKKSSKKESSSKSSAKSKKSSKKKK